MKPYVLPDPKTNPAAFLVLLYKTQKAIQYDDRAWDKIYFARCMKRTTQLLETFGGDIQMAARCMDELKDRFEGDGLSWTIETILQYSFDWRAENQKTTDRECMQRLLGGYAEERGLGKLQRIDPSDVLKKMLAMPTPPDKEKAIDVHAS